MAGVLGVATVGVAVRAGSSRESIDAAVELTCDTAEACASVEKLILKKRLDWSKELLLRMVGLPSLTIRAQATLMGYSDCFALVGVILVAASLSVMVLRKGAAGGGGAH